MADVAQILMCRPDYYGIYYEINPWMNTERQADHALAAEQWTNLHTALVDLGSHISLMPAVEGLPDLVFTANAGMVYQQTLILPRFRHEQRQGEEEHDAAWFEQYGFRVDKLPDDHFFEGAGDALFCGDTLFAGYRMRSEVKSHQLVADRVGRRVIPLELIDPYYYHLDTCFCPLAAGVAAYFPGAFDAYGLRAIRDAVETLIEVNAEEASSFACNAVVVGKTVVTNTGCPKFHASLSQHGFTTRETPLSEFVKAGGSAKCLTLRLDGEEAAAWRD
jgi:N-dimethylarginine dimethylaminohydrolase